MVVIRIKHKKQTPFRSLFRAWSGPFIMLVKFYNKFFYNKDYMRSQENQIPNFALLNLLTVKQIFLKANKQCLKT